MPNEFWEFDKKLIHEKYKAVVLRFGNGEKMKGGVLWRALQKKSL